MTAYDLLEELKQVITDGITNSIGFIKKSDDTTKKIPSVDLGYLPIKERKPGKPQEDPDEDFPYILIRYKEGEDDLEEGQVSVQILLGAYRDDETGWKDILNMIEVVRKTLITKSHFKNGALQYPIKYKIPEDQAIPYFHGLVEVKFAVGTYSVEGEVS